MTVFKPCPVCGRPLTTKDIRFFDSESLIGDMDMISDFENIPDPSNSCYPEDWKNLDEEVRQQVISDFEHILDPSNSCCPEDWKNLDEEVRQQVGKNYLACIEEVEVINVMCDCGLSIAIDRWSLPFPDEGWLDEFAAKVNRRANE